MYSVKVITEHGSQSQVTNIYNLSNVTYGARRYTIYSKLGIESHKVNENFRFRSQTIMHSRII